jgi:hypothetical protein
MAPTFIIKRANELVAGDMFMLPGQDITLDWRHVQYCKVIGAEETSNYKIKVFGPLKMLSDFVYYKIADFSALFNVKTRVWEFDQKLACLTNFDQLVEAQKIEIAAEEAEERKRLREESGALMVGQLMAILQKQDPGDYVTSDERYIREEDLRFEKP